MALELERDERALLNIIGEAVEAVDLERFRR